MKHTKELIDLQTEIYLTIHDAEKNRKVEYTYIKKSEFNTLVHKYDKLQKQNEWLINKLVYVGSRYLNISEDIAKNSILSEIESKFK